MLILLVIGGLILVCALLTVFAINDRDDEEVTMPCADIERKKAWNKLHNKRQGDDYRTWMASATPEQKRLWTRLKQIDTDPKHRAECMEIYVRLQAYPAAL